MENDVKVLEEVTETVDKIDVKKTNKSAVACIVLAGVGTIYLGSKIYGFAKKQIGKAIAKRNVDDSIMYEDVIDSTAIDSEE